MKVSLTTVFFVLFFFSFATAQNSDMEKMLDYSRPGTAHALLGQLSGSWIFQDAKLAFVKGILVRKAIFNGRFYSVEITGGKLQIPIAGGQMKEDNYQCLQTEGFDNIRNKFYTASVNNHIGSDIQYQSGSCDSAKKRLIYEWESEIMPGRKIVNRRIISITDSNHYIEEYFELQGRKMLKVRELDYTRN